MTPERTSALVPAQDSSQSLMQTLDAGELPNCMDTVQRHTGLVSFLSSHSTPLAGLCCLLQHMQILGAESRLQQHCRWGVEPARDSVPVVQHQGMHG